MTVYDDGMKHLSDSELDVILPALTGWRRAGGKLVQDREFPGFVEALHFLNELGEVAERRGHHPDIDIRYNRVHLGLVTHDAGGITKADTEMAAELNRRFPLA
jgi:4a-hydroxytetrahydrobiopterin dehydratase